MKKLLVLAAVFAITAFCGTALAGGTRSFNTANGSEINQYIGKSKGFVRNNAEVFRIGLLRWADKPKIPVGSFNTLNCSSINQGIRSVKWGGGQNNASVFQTGFSLAIKSRA